MNMFTAVAKDTFERGTRPKRIRVTISYDLFTTLAMPAGAGGMPGESGPTLALKVRPAVQCCFRWGGDLPRTGATG